MKRPSDPLGELARRCQERGLPVTPQRRAVLESLLARSGHPTADEVVLELARRIGGVSRATVYRTLETLVERGLLVRVCHPGAAVRYDLKTQRHHHLVCDRCGAIADLEAPALDALPLPPIAPTGFRMRDFSVHVRGLCPACVATLDREESAATP